MKKIKCYELDFGDTNLISPNIQDILNWIKADLDNLAEKDELGYTITIKFLTQKQFDKLPEWA